MSSGRPKDQQAAKIRALAKALVAEGFRGLDERAKVLGLCRSTAWTVLRGNHKASGLSATTINRMLAAPSIPLSVRAIILEYVEEKVAGVYGDSKLRRRQFAARLSEERRQATGGPRSLIGSPFEQNDKNLVGQMKARTLWNDQAEGGTMTKLDAVEVAVPQKIERFRRTLRSSSPS